MAKNIHKPGRRFPVGVGESGGSKRFSPVGGRPSGFPTFEPKKFGNAGSSGSAKRHTP